MCFAVAISLHSNNANNLLFSDENPSTCCMIKTLKQNDPSLYRPTKLNYLKLHLSQMRPCPSSNMLVRISNFLINTKFSFSQHSQYIRIIEICLQYIRLIETIF